MSENNPFVSIIIPTYNRLAALRGCLEALTRLDYPTDRFEVIVADDGSQTSLTDGVTAFANRLDITLLRQPNQGPAAARNMGIRHARGVYLVFTDDDCLPATHWLTAMVDRLNETPGCLVGGQTINMLTDNPYSIASQLLVSYLYNYYNPDPLHAQFFASNNLAAATGPLTAIGGFDQAYPRAAAEDRELCDRWRHAGYGMVYAPDAIVYHRHDLTPGSFWRQHFTYGRGAYAFHQARARRGLGRVRVEPLSFYTNLLRYPFTHPTTRESASRVSTFRLSCLLALSQVAHLLGYAWERFRR